MKAYLAGGCFWCITPTFRSWPGVCSVVSGYSGGDEADPTYAMVKSQQTGHRETIEVEYDPQQVSYEQLLEVFLNSIDPFDADGQFIDRGHSYTTAIYYLDEKQKDLAEKKLFELEEMAGQKVPVAIEAFKSFYAAEEYHQDYDLKNPEAFQKELIESGRLKETLID